MAETPYWQTPIAARSVQLLDARVAVYCPPVVEERILDSVLYAPAVASGPGHYRYGIVRAVGPGSWLTNGTRDPMQVEVGDRVFIGRHVSGEEFQLPWGEPCWIVLEDDIVGKLVPYTGGLNPPVDADRQWEIQPFADRLLVEHHPSPPMGFGDFARYVEAADLGLTVPEAYITAEWGTVVARGPGWRNEQGVTLPMECEPGDTVCFKGDQGVATRLAGRVYWTMREDQIEAVVTVPRVEAAAAPWETRVTDALVRDGDVVRVGPCDYLQLAETTTAFVPGQGRVTHRDVRRFYDAACRHPRPDTEAPRPTPQP